MNRGKLLRVVTVLSFIGLFILFLISEFNSYPVRDVCELEVGERVVVEGYAREISSYDSVTFFVIENSNCSIDGVIFEEVMWPGDVIIFY